MNKKMVILATVAILGLGAVMPFAMNGGDGVLKGAAWQGRSLAGYSQQQVQELMAKSNRLLQKDKIVFKYQDYTYEIPLAEVGAHVDEKEASRKIWAYGREGNWLRRWEERLVGYWQDREMAGSIQYDEAKLKEKLEQMSRHFAGPMRNAQLELGPDNQVKVVREVPHMELAATELEKQARQAIAQGAYHEIDLHPNKVETPKLTAQMLSGIDTVLGDYTTYFAMNANRMENIHVSAQAINHTLIPAQGEFSFNQTTGPRSYEAGYKDAPVFINGKLEPGVGGGICQVSSTLFNAALLAGMQITERTEHFAPVGYLDMGRDATVAYGYLDFRFRNPYQHPIYVVAQYVPGSIRMVLLGTKADKPQESQVSAGEIKTIPHQSKDVVSNTQKEDKVVAMGHDGFERTIYRYIRHQDGTEVHDSFSSYYEPVDTITTWSVAGKKKEEEMKKAAAKKLKEEKKKETGVKKVMAG